MKKTEKIEIRLTKLEKEKFLEMQANLGYSSLSEMVRHLILNIGGIKMVKGNAQEGLRKWFEAWEIEITEAWKATEEDGSWSAYENFYRDWEQNYKEWCVMGDWEQVESFKKEIRKVVKL